MQLHNHSQFSVLDGSGLIKDYIELAAADGQEAFALTDHGTLGGIIELYGEAKKHDVKPIAGMELYVDAFELRERDYPGHLTVLARNEAGYRALIAVNNLAHRQFYYRPRITLQQIIDNNFAEDWIILSGCMSSPINRLPISDAVNIVKQLSQHSGGMFLETMWHWSADEEFDAKQNLYLERVAELHRQTQLPIVITNDCHFAHKHKEDMHLSLMAHSSGKHEGIEFDGEGFHFKTIKQMQELANSLGVPNAVDTAVEISKMCDLVIPEADNVKWYVPDLTNGRPEEAIREAVEGRLQALPQEYRDRFEYEMSVIRTSPSILNSYLVAHDIITWCWHRDIPAAARGSMAGSLVSYLLGITAEDPIKYRLSFSRAVNPARPTIPDFDLDVSQHHRQEILEYLKDKYENNVPIASYTHYGPKGALRKILRMEGLRNPTEQNLLCKPLPDDWADGDFTYSPTAKTYIGNTPWFETVPEQYRNYVAIYQGLYSTMSAHPCGVLVGGPERVLEHEVPFQWIASSKQLVSAYDMYTLKKLGLFKLDVLGLRTLDQLAYMERLSGETLPDDNYDEPEVLAAFGADLLAEIFQMDGYACRNVLKDIRGVETFEDIIAANTLARPGCSQFTPYYRSGYESLLREYPQLQDVLGPTNGLILYQEQVMEISRILADFDDSEQDDVKEAIKYFRHEVWSRTIEPLWRSRCEAKGINPTNILEAVSKMASYTYNRAHAMTYAALAYKMMWYKVHHPAIYYAAVYDGAEDKSRLVLESHFFGVEWQHPDINESEGATIVRDGRVILGLNAIKGVGPAAYEAIVTKRPFSSVEDFLERVEKRKCNIKVYTALVAAFAFQSFGTAGDRTAFNEAFGFHYRFMDSTVSRSLCDWQKESGVNRLGGFITDLREIKIQKAGPNQGKEMGRANVVNINGAKHAIMFPDVWKKARGVLYQGAAVKLIGNYQVDSGDFIVETGSAE